MELELLAHGFGLVEAPRTDAAGNLYFTDVTGGGVFRRGRDGEVACLVPGRMGVGGLAVHADGGLVMSGSDVVHWREGGMRLLLGRPEVTFWNDLHTDGDGQVYVGSVCGDVSDLRAPRQPGQCWRIGAGGAVEPLYGGVALSNGIGLSPDGSRLYHVDSTSKGYWVHDVSSSGEVSGGRHVAPSAFERGIPDGLCVGADGNLWIAHVAGGRVVQLDPAGELVSEIPVPARAVTSVAFGGPDWDELYIVTADNADDAAKRGSIFRCRPGVSGVPTPPATV